VSNGNGQILFRYYGNVLSMSQSGATSDGYLSSADWNRFNNTAAGAAPVQSVFGRTGAIAAQAADYSGFYPSLMGNYADPSWITSLDFGKLINAPAPSSIDAILPIVVTPTPLTSTGTISLASTIPSGAVTTFYVGAKARFTALSNGLRLEIEDAGGNWVIQQDWIE
jgi:hypothetical protein